MIRIEGLTLTHGDFRLGPIDLRIERGSCHALLGPSGAGKSTLVAALLGLHPLEGGSILRGERPIHTLPVHKRGFGYLPQHLALFPHLSVEANILYGIRARGLDPAPLGGHIDRLIDAASIRPLLARKPDTLSGGERQRVALVRALAPRPDALLLDEPFGALDRPLRRELWELTRFLVETFDTAVVLVTHDLEEAFTLADTISILIDGQIRQSGTKEELFRRPASEAVARYLGIVNIFDARVADGKGRIVEIPALGIRLQSHAPLPDRTPFRVAFRSDGIVCTDHDSAAPNRIEGECRILETLPARRIRFIPTGSRETIEITLPRDAAGCEGGCAVSIPPEEILFLDPEA
ncbi:ABC transporter ATP-binding protein [Nitratifractor sp.]